MNSALFFAVFAVLALFYTILGFLASKKIKTTSDYFLAGRNLGLFSVTLTLIATQVGGGMLVGTSQDAYLYGIYGILYTVGMAVGFVLLGSGLASKLQSLNVATTAELFETRYGSTTLKTVASLLSVITMTGILIGQVVASRTIIEILQFGSGNELIFIGFWIFVILYTMVGGLKAVVITDVFQVLLIIAIFSGIFIYSFFFGPSFDWGALMTIQKEQFGSLPISMNMVIATLIMPILFSLIEQDLAQRFFAARTKWIATLSALLTAGFMILFALVPIYFGMQAKLLGLSIPAGSSPLMATIELLTNEFVVVLALCAIIAAITSTADSLLCAISSNLAQDFDFSWLGKHNALSRSKIITLIAGLVALGASFVVPQNIIDILIGSYAISVSCLFVPLVWSYFTDRISKQAAILSVAAGFISWVAMLFWKTDAPKALVPLACSFIGYCIGLLLQRRSSEREPVSKDKSKG
ncbi:sodium:solute symporter family protein [Candidatus Dependentiae bacterium]|nr:MAG: sodium:solute symporter family protein [Candidatus Dependentiae bacterium]